MLEQLKKICLAALGAMKLTPDEVRTIIGEFREQGILTGEQESRLLEALLGQKTEEGREAAEGLGKELQRLAGLIPLVSRQEFQDLADRVQKIEDRMGPDPRAPDKLSPRGEEE